MIECIETGLVYRNPSPHLRAVHTWHPTVVRFDDGEIVVGFDCGQGAESLDYRTYVTRSTDTGRTWQPPVRVFEDRVARPATHSVRLSRTPDGTLLAFGGRYYRDNPEEGLVNRANLGYVPMELITLRSPDRGRTWQGPAAIAPPLVGPAFETCHPIVVLPDGRWLGPTSTWKGWDGQVPNGMKAIALVSRDQGRTWPEYLDVANEYDRGIIHWEISLTRLTDNRLLAVTWAYDEKTGLTHPTPYTISADGVHFLPLRPTGLRAQTAKLLLLPDGRVLCLYRRNDKPGLWANLSRIEGNNWVNIEEAQLWQGAPSGMTGQTAAATELSDLRFGFPGMVNLPDGTVFAVFWCCEDYINNVRWLRLRV